jgi:putative FmdB family regulatory protein
MPIYEYRRPDGTTFEVVQSFSEDPLARDPDTGVPVERVLHAPAVHFKGKGFYNTDYGTRKRQRETAASADGSTSAGSSSTDGSSESSSKSEPPAKADAKKGELSTKPAEKAGDAKPVAAAK